MGMNENLGKHEIHKDAQLIRIIAYKGFREALVNPDALQWNEDDDECEYLSLSDISDQLPQLGFDYPYYVWAESGISGTIYQYGNYQPPTWVEHGTTRGYA